MKLSELIKQLVGDLSTYGDGPVYVSLPEAVRGTSSTDLQVEATRYDSGRGFYITCDAHLPQDDRPLFRRGTEILDDPRSDKTLRWMCEEALTFLSVERSDLRWLLRDVSAPPCGSWDTTYDWVLFMGRAASRKHSLVGQPWGAWNAFYHRYYGSESKLLFTGEDFHVVWCSRETALGLQEIYGPDLLKSVGAEFF